MRFPGEWRYTRQGCFSQVAATIVAAMVLGAWWGVGWLLNWLGWIR